MPDTDIGSADTSDYDTSLTNEFSVGPETTDGATGSGETRWTNSKWTEQLGLYKKIPELKSAIDAKARWVVGKGFVSNEITEMALSAIKGNGIDTFNSILQNGIRVYHIGGDSYAEIIRDDEGNLINLKPLTPENVVIVANSKGLIIRYEQTSQIKGAKNKKFTPEQIFHLSRDRVADEIHGTGIIEACEENILMRNEAMADYKKLLHRNVCPVRKHILDTDDTTKVDAYKAQVLESKNNFEDMFIPKGTVETEIESVASNAIIDPKPWINVLTQKFYQETGVPQIIVGGAQEITEASAKIAYLAWEQTVEEEQLYIEEQVLAQLNLEIDLEFPASLQNEMLSDNRKAETMQASTPEDTAVTGGQME